MKRRTIIEIGLLVLGVVLGAWAVLDLGGESTPPADAPEPVAVIRPEAVTAEWRGWRGDAGLTGASDEAVPDAVGVVWRYRTGGPVLSSPVVAGGRVICGSHDDKVHCVDAATGEPVWTFATPDDVEAPPLVIDGRVVVGSANGTLYAIDEKSGEGLWTYETGDKILGSANFYRPPGLPLRVLVGSYDRRLHCVDAATGAKLWSVSTEDYINGGPALLNDAAIFGGCDGMVHVVDALSGKARLDVPLGDGAYIPGSVAVDRGTAFAAHVGNGVAAVAIGTGEVVWSFAAEDGFFSSPALAPDRVVVGGRDRKLHALDRETGEVLWTFSGRDGFDSSPVIAGDRVVVGSNDGRVYAVSLEEGELVWEFALGGPVTGSVAVAGGLVFVPCEDGSLYALGSRR